MIKHIIFDFDGVIADTFDMNWALSQEHDEHATLEDFLAHHDGNVFETPRINFKPEHLDEFYSEYRKRITPTHLQTALEPIKRLGSNYTLHVVSSTSEHAIREVLEHAGVIEFFSRLMGAETHPSKAEKFRMLMDEEAITPENSIFITDTLGDVKEAHKVGFRTIAETFGFHDRERLEQGNPFKIVDSWEEIEAIIKELNETVA